MEFQRTKLPDVYLIKPRVLADERGWFAETWHAREFQDCGIGADFVQDNQSRSRRWVLRGMHYQVRHAQGKLVRVLNGEIFDVAVDLRRSSPSFGAWVGERLSSENHRMLWVPPGFAHGFLTLTEWADVAYKVTDYYAPEHERRVAWNDAQLRIEWPLPRGVTPVMDVKDAAAPALAAAECFN